MSSTKTTYLVIRHGSNGANQPMTQSMPICFVTASDADQARKLAAKRHTVYNNQFLQLVKEADCDPDEWNVAVEDDLPHYEPATTRLAPAIAVAV